MAKEEQSKADIEDLTGKLEEEKRKYDDHLNNKLDLEEKMKLATESMEDYKGMIDVQDAEIAELKAQIETKNASVNALTAGNDEAKKINFAEDKRHRILSKENAALTAKLKFIKEKYDFTSNVKNLKPDEF